MRCYIIAGEASGDLHASNLLKELKSRNPDTSCRGFGGDLLQSQGAELVKHYRDLAFMGFAEVVSHLPEIMENFRLCKKDLLAFRPEVLILVDYPGFNLPMAKFAARHGIRVFYYISPQLWAWHSSRVKTIRKYVDKMFVILPFEQEFYARYGYKVDFLGHPLLDVINGEMPLPDRKTFLASNNLPDHPIIALLPGSRKMEIRKMLKTMIAVSASFPDYQFVVAGAPSVEPAFYREMLDDRDVAFVSGQTYALLGHAQAALVTSGTATLEAALMGVPQVVCYRGNPLSYLLARQLVHVRFISLVNLVCEKRVVPELIQDDFSPERLSNALGSMLKDNRIREEILTGYAQMRSLLGGPGASARVAGLMMQYLTEN